jgi:hypothetical protein
MIIKNDMKQNNKANNLQCGRIYTNNNTGQPARLVNIIPCTGVWLETFDGQGYGDLVKFEDVSYASPDEVQDFLEDFRVYNATERYQHGVAPSHKVMDSWERQVDMNEDVYIREDEDYLCRD